MQSARRACSKRWRHGIRTAPGFQRTPRPDGSSKIASSHQAGAGGAVVALAELGVGPLGEQLEGEAHEVARGVDLAHALAALARARRRGRRRGGSRALRGGRPRRDRRRRWSRRAAARAGAGRRRAARSWGRAIGVRAADALRVTCRPPGGVGRPAGSSFTLARAARRTSTCAPHGGIPSQRASAHARRHALATVRRGLPVSVDTQLGGGMFRAAVRHQRLHGAAPAQALDVLAHPALDARRRADERRHGRRSGRLLRLEPARAHHDDERPEPQGGRPAARAGDRPGDAAGRRAGARLRQALRLGQRARPLGHADADPRRSEDEGALAALAAARPLRRRSRATARARSTTPTRTAARRSRSRP